MNNRLAQRATLSAVLGISAVLASIPAHANHGWTILSLTCRPGSISMLINENASTGTSVFPQIEIGGTFYKSIGDLDLHNDFNGNHVYVDTDPAYTAGSTIRVYNTGGGSVGGPSSATCTIPPQVIPALSDRMLLALGGLLALTGVALSRRRRSRLRNSA